MTDYDWPPEALDRLRAEVLKHAGLPRHSFGRRWLDAPSIQPERIPAHRAPKHRADRHEDSCGLACGAARGWIPCDMYIGRRRAEAA